MICSRLLATLLLSAAAANASAADWRYSIGIHDFAVPDINSDTYGINGGVWVDKQTDGGRHVYGSAVLYLDYDQDDNDPSRYPIWWAIHLGTDGDFWKGERTRLGWNADLNTRMSSTNGCFVNDERVTKQRLQDGDVVRIGDRSFRFACNHPGS